jgi:hypothetical protein
MNISFCSVVLSLIQGIALTQEFCLNSKVGHHSEGSPWPSSGSCLVLVLCLGKIRLLELVLSNFENISYVAFLKHKTVEKRELTLWHLVNRLVLEIA